MKQLKFSNRTKVRLVEIEEEKYELREMKASVRDKYMDKLQQRLKVSPKGDIIGITKYDGMQSDLLTQSLYDAAGKPVAEAVMKDWPSSVVQALFEASQEINSLRKPAERNRIAAEQVAKWLATLEDLAVGEQVEGVRTKVEEILDETDRKLFAEKEDDTEA